MPSKSLEIREIPPKIFEFEKYHFHLDQHTSRQPTCQLATSQRYLPACDQLPYISQITSLMYQTPHALSRFNNAYSPPIHQKTITFYITKGYYGL
jgi:hypothetical protein